MAITNYTELQAAAANWLVRRDLTARVPEFIALGEARLNRVLRARLAESDQPLTGVIGLRTVALPAVFAEPVALWITPPGAADRCEMRFVDPALIGASTTPGQPYYWTISGANIVFERSCDLAYAFTLRMLAKFALSDAAPTNALLTDYPDAYLFATLSEAAPFLRNADLAAAYETKLERAIGEINAKDARSRAGAKLTTEPAALTAAPHSFNINTGR